MVWKIENLCEVEVKMLLLALADLHDCEVDTCMTVRWTLAPHYFLKFIKFINKILYFYILFYLYLYN